MDNANLEETRPAAAQPDGSSNDQTSPVQVPVALTDPPVEADEPQPPRRRGCLLSWLVWVFVGIVLLIAIAVLSALSGQKAGMEIRRATEATAEALEVVNQFKLAVLDMDAGRFGLSRQRLEWFRQQPRTLKPLNNEIILELTRQYQLGLEDMAATHYDAAQLRYEWIIEWDPTFPEITDRLAEVIYQRNTTATPTLMPTQTLTPTPDLRGVEELFNAAQQSLTAGQWTIAIDTLLTLRKSEPDYKTVQVDGMLYLAYRNRGVDKIYFSKTQTDSTITKSDLEGGLYDLAVAERFGPLDQDSETWRRRAAWYITGASFWEVDWAQAVYYFEQLTIESPYLFDSAGYAAIDRYRLALIGYGDWLTLRGEWCLAQEQYEKALAMSANPTVEPTATYVSEQCASGAEGETEPTPEGGEATPTQSSEQPTETQPVEEPTPTETQASPASAPSNPYP